MIDIRLLRDEKTRKLVKKSERDRFKDDSIVDKLYLMDQKRIKLKFKIEQFNREINKNQKEINQAIKSNKGKVDAKEIISQLEKVDLKKDKGELEKELKELESEINILLVSIGNVLSDKVPVCKTEDGNLTVKTFKKEGCVVKKHSFVKLMEQYTNAVAGSLVLGHRGYFLQGKMAQLALALKTYALTFLSERGYIHIQTPVMMKREVMKNTAQLSDFDDQLYKVDGGYYLIATSEQPLSALHMNQHMQPTELPKCYAGESLCFRKEAGAYGKDNAGLFRVHQFEKIEQFVICNPDESDEYLEKMIKTAEEFLASLDIPYRIVCIASGEMNDSASLKYDIEAWFPESQKYRELVSASNCTDYQSRSMSVYYGNVKNKTERPVFVHMLNATLCAVQRSLCCIVENYQNDDGTITVPNVLRKFLNFDKF
ncbi:SYS [Hepatospora eriocheir]|uniref:serine--tRNA ligase n=1 Tax=Hepatospora eriocheir TaxID=1081669 RepID=A0A1X0QD35_9MICR|nr:SYS [Hepatospora eriocheir]